MINDDVDDSGTKIEPESHKEHPESVNDDDDQIEKEKNDEEIEKKKKYEEIEKEKKHDDHEKIDEVVMEKDDDDDVEKIDEGVKEKCNVDVATGSMDFRKEKIRRFFQEILLIREVLYHCNKVVPELTFVKTNEMINKEMPHLVNIAVNKDREVNPINAQEIISNEFDTHAPKMIEELFRKHMQHTTLNLYPTISSSTVGKSTADLQQQLYLKMKSTPKIKLLWNDCLSSNENVLSRLDLLEQHLTKYYSSRTDCTTTLTDLRTKFENAFHSEFEALLFKEDLKGTRIEHGFKRAFMSLFGKDDDTFTSMMLLNVDQLQMQLDKDEFQEDGSMASFWYFAKYTGIEVKQFRDTLLQLIGNVKKSVAERTCHQRKYDRKSSGTESEVQDDNRRSGNDTDVDDADIRPIYDEELMVEVQLTVECKIFAIGKQHTEQPEIINEVTQHYLPKKTEIAFAKPDHMIASSSSRNSSKNMPRFSSNDMVHNHYLDVAKKKIQERDRNSTTSEVNSRANIQSHKTRNSNKPVDQKSHTQKPGRQIFIGHRFSPNKTSVVYEKTSPRSDLRWKPNSAGTSINVQKEQSLDLSAGTLCNVNKENLRVWLLKKLISQKPLSKWIHR
ncbi:hypothetical protein Tco_1517479 [Tanacetum coccineum]